MSPKLEITINTDARCTRCKKKGATQSGYCLRCVADFICNGNKWPDTGKGEA